MKTFKEKFINEAADSKTKRMESELEKLLKQYGISYKIEEKMTGNKTFRFGGYKVSVGGVFAYEYTLFKGEKEIKAQISIDAIEKLIEDELVPEDNVG
jgi:hypothetical protein